MQSANIKYVPQVDHLRAIAALWIIFYHGEQLIGSILRTGKWFAGEWQYSLNPLVSVIREGHTAVALFMVLSGFIFTYGTYGRSVDYGRFITNRLLRIYPLFLCVVMVGIAANPASFKLAAFITTILPLANVQLLQTGPFTAMAWAVAVEFQFYLIFPFLLRFLNEGMLRFILSVLACALLFRLIAVGLGGNARDLSYWHIVGRIDQFAAGMVAAAALRNFQPEARIMRFGLVVAVALTIGMLFGFHRLGGWPVNAPWKVIWPTIEALVYALLIASYVASGSLLSQSASRWLAALGATSFSIYLLHIVIIELAIRHGWVLRLTGSAGIDAIISTVIIVMPLTLLASTLTYRCIELPFLRLRKKYIRDLPGVASPAVASPVPAVER